MIDIWCARCRVTKLGWMKPDAKGVTIICPHCGFQHEVGYEARVASVGLDRKPPRTAKLRLTTA